MVCCRVVNAPYGPSTRTRDPTGRWRSPALVAPTAFAVRRSPRPSGASDRENGFACHQPKWPGKRQMQNWPARAGRRLEVAAGDVDRHDVVGLRDDRGDPEAVAQVAADRHDRPAHEQRAEDQRPHRPPVGGGERGVEGGPFQRLVDESEPDRDVEQEVDVAEDLVRQPPPCPSRGDDHHHDDDRGGAHPQQRSGHARQAEERLGTRTRRPGARSRAARTSRGRRWSRPARCRPTGARR